MGFQCHLRFALVIATVALFARSSLVSGSDLSKFLHSVFDDHHQRSPNGTEMYYHANLSRNNGPLESYIALVSSNDFFVNQCQRNTQVYVTRLYQIFLNRDPFPDELRFWVNQYYAGGENRGNLVRQFCQANNIYSVPGPPQPNRPPSP